MHVFKQTDGVKVEKVRLLRGFNNCGKPLSAHNLNVHNLNGTLRWSPECSIFPRLSLGKTERIQYLYTKPMGACCKIFLECKQRGTIMKKVHGCRRIHTRVYVSRYTHSNKKRGKNVHGSGKIHRWKTCTEPRGLVLSHYELPVNFSDDM